MSTGENAQKPSIFQAVNPKSPVAGSLIWGRITLGAGANAEMELYGD
jgi:hypothetical protein